MASLNLNQALSSGGLKITSSPYIPASSQVNPNAMNYRVPASSMNSATNAYGNTIYNTGGYNDPQKGVLPASTQPTGAYRPAVNTQQQTGTTLNLPSQDDLFRQVDSAFGDIYGNLNQQESNLRAGEQDLYNSFTGQIDAQRPILDQGYQSGLAVNSQNQNTVKQQEANALASARNMYNELQQGVKQRFGGSNSAGEVADAFFGREFQKNTGNIQNTSGQNIQALLTQRQDLETKYNSQLQSLEAQKQAALAQAKDVFRQRLDAINNARLGADQNKAQLKLQELQQMRQTVQNIQLAAIQQQQQLQAIVAQQAGQLAANVEAFKAQAGQTPNLSAIPQATYSAFNYAQPQTAGAVTGYYDPTRRQKIDAFGNFLPA